MITRPSVNGLRATYLKVANQPNFLGKSIEKGACIAFEWLVIEVMLYYAGKDLHAFAKN